MQAKANYKTFRKNDLVKRCLYLFAALTAEDGTMGACIFAEPRFLVDDTFFFDYCLFFVCALTDYLKETGDYGTAVQLWSSAYRQIEIAREQFDEKHLFQEGALPCFIDWKDGLDKQASAQGVFIMALKNAAELTHMLGYQEQSECLRKEAEMYAASAGKYLWDEKEQLFISGEKRQISYASQIWMVLSGVVTGKEAAGVLKRCAGRKPEMSMVTPFLNHFYVEALMSCGEENRAIAHIKYYWGGMIAMGADTFWEMYDPENPEASPYGCAMVNSYCHAWSCTPVCFLRKDQE